MGIIVGIGSTAQVGKDTSAQALCRDLGFRQASFADKLKEMALIADPLVHANAVTNVSIGSGRLKRLVTTSPGWEHAKNTYPEVRRFLQALGEAGRTVFGDDFWLEQVMKSIKPGENVVISDVRFANEFDAIKDAGGLLIKIVRPSSPQYGHVSESGLPDKPWDHEVLNYGSLIELEQEVVDLVRAALRKQDTQLSLGHEE